MKNAVDGNSIEMAISKMDIVIRNKIINSMEIYNLIRKLVFSQLNATMLIFMQSLFLRILTVFELVLPINLCSNVSILRSDYVQCNITVCPILKTSHT